METIDDETTEHALGFIDKCHNDGKPFFLWYNTTAMHFRTHRAEKHKGKSGQGDYNDVMVAHDENISRMLNGWGAGGGQSSTRGRQTAVLAPL